MESQQELLTYIIENNIFESSWSALAKHIDYTNRTLPDRLKKGTVKESTVESILDRICLYFEFSKSELLDIVDEMMRGKSLFEIIKADNPYADEKYFEDKILVDFVKLSFENYSDDFKNNILPHIIELRNSEPFVYYGMVMFFYIKLKRFNPYEGNIEYFHKKLKAFTSHIVNVIKRTMPENFLGENISLVYLSDKIINSTPQCIYGLTLYNIHLLRFFSDNNYFNEMLHSGSIFPEWGEFSYWHKSGASYKKGERVWTLFSHKSDSSLHGRYIGHVLEVGKDNETFISHENFIVLFWNKYNNDDTDALIQVSNVISSENDTYTLYYGRYFYDKENDELNIEWDSDEENIFGIPNRMKRISMEKPKEKNEQIWTNIIKRFDDNDSLDKHQDSMTKRTNIQYLFDDYEIEDVIISRNDLTIKVIYNNEHLAYNISIDAYPFLHEINVFDDICIKKNIITGKFFVEWIVKGYHIPLSEFTSTP